jgi:hypothetical protein
MSEGPGGTTPFPVSIVNVGRHRPAAINGATDPLLAWVKVQETGFPLAEVIAAELCPASAPDLAMLVITGCLLRRRWGEKDVPL